MLSTSSLQRITNHPKRQPRFVTPEEFAHIKATDIAETSIYFEIGRRNAKAGVEIVVQCRADSRWRPLVTPSLMQDAKLLKDIKERTGTVLGWEVLSGVRRTKRPDIPWVATAPESLGWGIPGEDAQVAAMTLPALFDEIWKAEREMQDEREEKAAKVAGRLVKAAHEDGMIREP